MLKNKHFNGCFMALRKNKTEKNIEYANRWLNRSIKDFNLFKRLVPFDRKTKKPVISSDPALAVYLLQQCVEKAVKAAAIASQQYEYKDIRRFSHNSLALIISLNSKMVARVKSLGLDLFTDMIGVNFKEGEHKLGTLEKQLAGEIQWVDKNGKKVDIKTESRSIPSEVIDKILDTSITSRKMILDIIRNTFGVLPEIGVKKGQKFVKNPVEFLQMLSNGLAGRLKLNQPSEKQLKGIIEFVKQMGTLGFPEIESINRKETIMNFLSAWAFSCALLWLTYLTFAHESTARYPLKYKGNIKRGRIGCDDYDNDLGIVNRIGKIGYATSLTLNEMKRELDTIAFFFAFDRSKELNS